MTQKLNVYAVYSLLRQQEAEGSAGNGDAVTRGACDVGVTNLMCLKGTWASENGQRSITFSLGCRPSNASMLSSAIRPPMPSLGRNGGRWNRPDQPTHLGREVSERSETCPAPTRLGPTRRDSTNLPSQINLQILGGCEDKRQGRVPCRWVGQKCPSEVHGRNARGTEVSTAHLFRSCQVDGN